jgi:cytochrome c oxidase cbb3-type subunit III
MPGFNRLKINTSTFSKAATVIAAWLLSAPAVMANGGGSAPKESSMYDPFVITMVIIMLILLLAIGLLANVVMGAAGYYHQKEKEREQNKPGSAVAVTASVIALLLFSAPVFAQDATAAATSTQAAETIAGLSPVTFYFILGVIGAELLVIFMLLYQLRVFLSKEKLQQSLAGATEYKLKPKVNIWDKLNSFKPVEHEAQITLDHEYDGIRELDNRLPPWWLYGFYATIIFAGIYLWRYHVSHTAPLSHEELQIAMKQAEEQKAIYLKQSANNVDENTVKQLTEAADVAGGEKVFIQNCAACHGKAGEGVVGPNLTDDYWLHGGSVKDVFKTIKYGWPEKGMRSWKDDLSPMQIAQVTSYIKSIHGTNPPNAKAKQGELYQEENNSNNKSDSISNKVAVVTNK